MAVDGTSNRAERKPVNPWLVLLVLCLGFFMIILDTTIVNIAIPAMLDGLDASFDQIIWVVNAYLLAYAMLLITAGRLGDYWGPRNLFIAGLVVFILASAACGLAQNSEQLIVARVVQGVGGALLTPQTLAIIAIVFPANKRGAAMGVWGSVIGLSTVAGPIIGGLLVNNASWRWIFIVNIPIGLVALAGAIRFVPDPRPAKRHGLDAVGVLLASAGLFLLVYALIEGERYDWGKIRGPVSIPALIVAAVVILVGFAFWERRPAEPLLPLSLFRVRNYTVMNWVQGVTAFGMLGVYLPLVLVLQSVLGMSALRAGLTLVPLSVASIFAAPIAGRMSDKYGGKYILMAGLAVFAGGVALMIPAIKLDAGMSTFVLPNIVAGFGLGLTMAPLTAEAMRNIPPQQVGAASGMLNTTRQVGSVIGTAVVGAVLQNRLAARLTEGAQEASAQLPADVRGPFEHVFGQAAENGLQVAPGQSGVAALPADVPADVAAEMGRIASEVFLDGFVGAARQTLWVPIAVLAVGLVSCVVARSRHAAARPGTGQNQQPAAESQGVEHVVRVEG